MAGTSANQKKVALKVTKSQKIGALKRIGSEKKKKKQIRANHYHSLKPEFLGHFGRMPLLFTTI